MDMDYNINANNRCGFQCCDIRLFTGWMSALNTKLGEINQHLCTIEQSVSGNQTALFQLYATLATNNPMSVAAEFPTQEPDRVTYATTRVLFSDMLNPQLAVLFKQPFNVALPVYFKDLSNYEHIVTFGDTSTPALSSQLVNNYPYQALYVGNYIVLNPTAQTMDDFKNGTII